ncbi:MAG: hypothetical protein ACM3TU_01650 [Bacillota bacterium]
MSKEHHFWPSYERMPDTSIHPERLQELQFHLESGDYFPLLSTILGFLEEGMRQCEQGVLALAPVEAEVLENLRMDLIYLHKHYEISPKS